MASLILTRSFRKTTTLYSQRHAFTHYYNTKHFISLSPIINKQISVNFVSNDSVKEFIYTLSPDERDLFSTELNRFQTQALTEKIPNVKPTQGQLKTLFMCNFLPFIAFGFSDNFIMVLAGDYLDSTIGVSLGISTLAAAGLGNLFSDVVGLSFTAYIERVCGKFGFHVPSLTPSQTQMLSTRMAINFGRSFGIIVGCIAGMVPLLFRKKDKKKELLVEKEMRENAAVSG